MRLPVRSHPASACDAARLEGSIGIVSAVSVLAPAAASVLVPPALLTGGRER